MFYWWSEELISKLFLYNQMSEMFTGIQSSAFRAGNLFFRKRLILCYQSTKNEGWHIHLVSVRYLHNTDGRNHTSHVVVILWICSAFNNLTNIARFLNVGYWSIRNMAIIVLHRCDHNFNKLRRGLIFAIYWVCTYTFHVFFLLSHEFCIYC